MLKLVCFCAPVLLAAHVFGVHAAAARPDIQGWFPRGGQRGTDVEVVIRGKADNDGMFVKDAPVEVPDLVATIYRKLGIDYTKEYLSNIGRPIKLADNGKPLDWL